MFSSFRMKLIWRMSPRLFPEILGMFFNTLTAYGKFPLEDWENLQLQSECNYLKNAKLFLNFFPFRESTSKFKYFEQKDDGHS